MPLELIPHKFAVQYNLYTQSKNGYAYMQIEHGIYGLPQADILANKTLREKLTPHGYCDVPNKLGLWKHVSQPV